jgi:hypothetical protein
MYYKKYLKYKSKYLKLIGGANQGDEIGAIVPIVPIVLNNLTAVPGVVINDNGVGVGTDTELWSALAGTFQCVGTDFMNYIKEPLHYLGVLFWILIRGTNF